MARFINIQQENEIELHGFSVTDYVILYWYNEFIVLRFGITNSTKLDMVENIFNQLKSKRKEIISVQRSYIFDSNLKNFRLRNEKLQKYHAEINYIYQGFGKLNCFLTKLKFIDKWLSNHNENLKKDYLDAKKILEEYGLNHLENDLETLYESNILHDCTTKIEHFKTIEHLTKKLKTKKNETSKH
jgi:hypothetical protein